MVSTGRSFCVSSGTQTSKGEMNNVLFRPHLPVSGGMAVMAGWSELLFALPLILQETSPDLSA